jgi:pimeloyl-ACP methyl ester carboxylesterase
MTIEQVTVAEGMLTAARTGVGRDLVVLHSLLADRHAFDPVLPGLAHRFHVTLVNLPGFHGSQPAEASMDAYVGRIAAALDELEIGSDAILLGNGFGGTIALALVLAHPGRFARLVLSDVAPGFPEAGKQAFRVMAERVAAGGMGAIADIAANRVFHAAHLAEHREAIEERRAVLMKIDPVAFQAACTILVEADLVPQLRSVRLPTLVVCGELDQATPPALNRLIADNVPDARFVELPGCGHCPPLEQPGAFLGAIHDFISV